MEDDLGMKKKESEEFSNIDKENDSQKFEDPSKGATEEESEPRSLTDEEKKEYKNKSLELKTLGNNHFKVGEYEDALEMYSQGIEKCLDEFSEDKAILFANRAACYMKMNEHTSAIKDCTAALELNPKYIKARIRRAQSYEATDKLDEAFEDYKAVLEQDRTNGVAGEACLRLPDQIKERNEKLKEEMMGKLKDLGNMVLKPFGLSTDNFQVQQDPNTGGYSINFQK